MIYEQIIRWQTARIEQRRGTPGKTETFVDVLCTGCNRTRRVTLSTAKRSQGCAQCARLDALNVARQNPEAWLQGIRRRLLRDMTAPELLVMNWLNALPIPYEMQKIFISPAKTFFVDFVVGTLAIEVNGWQHKNRLKMAYRDEQFERAWTGNIVWLDACNLAKPRLRQGEFDKLVAALQQERTHVSPT